MTTNSTYGWPIITKTDMFKPSVISAAQGAAFDNRVVLERARHERTVASISALPGTGHYVGQACWVQNINMPYYWNGATWKPANGVEGGFLHVSSITWSGTAAPMQWSNEISISLPTGRFTADPSAVVNAYAADRVIWASVSRKTTPSTIHARLMAVQPGAGAARIYWVAVDSN